MNKKTFSARRTGQLKKIGWVTFFYLFMAVVVVTYDYAILNIFGYDGPFSFWRNAFAYLSGLLFAAPFASWFIVMRLEKSLRQQSYGRVLLSILFTFSVIYFTVSLLATTLYNTSFFDVSPFEPAVWEEIKTYLFSLGFFKEYCLWLVITLIASFAIQVNDKYGPGVLWDFLMGKYYHPRREERIFMFLDMRSSTTIAEQLGEEKYFNLIRELFSDVTEPILATKGEIYQYIGDEIIISWKMKKGLVNANCLQCFFGVQEKINHKAEDYQMKYGLVPAFKAGIHGGYVMAGEVGDIKRDIAFSGDVLNTTARIQGMCNELGVDLLISEFLLEQLKTTALDIQAKRMGNIALKGKMDKVVLFNVVK